jgi:PAS domain S-box-containing protein
MAILDLAVPVDRPNTVYAAGSTGLFRTDDAGRSWRKLLSVERTECEPDEACVREPVYRSVAVAPYDAQHIIVAREGKRGIMVSKNGGTSWKPAQLVNGASDRALTIHELVFSPVTRGLVYALEYDRHSLLISKDGGLTWRIRALSEARRPLGLAIPKSGGDVEPTYVVTDGSGLFRVSESIERFGPPVGRVVDADCANMTCVTTDPAGGLLLSLNHGRRWKMTSCRYPHAEPVHDGPRAVKIGEGRPLELYTGYQDNRWLARWRISSGNLAHAELLRAFSLPQDLPPDAFTSVHDIEIKRESPHSLLVGVEETRSREEPALVALPLIGEYHVRGYASLVYHVFVFVGFIVVGFLVFRNAWRGRTVRWETALLSSSLLLLIPALQYERVSSASTWPLPWTLPAFALLFGVLLLVLIRRYETLFVRPRRLAHELIAGIHAPILVLDSSYRILAVNKAAEYVFGYKEFELEGAAVDAVFARIQERELCQCDLDDYARESKSFDSVCRSRDGEQFRCVLSFSFLGAARGQKLGYIVSLTFNPDFQRIQNRFGFTKREMDVLRVLLQGMRYREIAERLCISIPTVKSHVHHIYEKSEAKNRFHLIRLVK